ncbi:hypothetical protein Mgra_00001992 [Meloidogyne graminicola]|uniref:Uncharacterized protein n=1 Tax=Meloidogyne graminicola TaxID=189291 RepID=A0A8S9ZXY9_9BILA|nr:hypothetical protein Mgra_00001992 [Meloidogyne graminicola]
MAKKQQNNNSKLIFLLFLIFNFIIFNINARPLNDDEGIQTIWKMRTDKKAMRNSLVRFGKRSSLSLQKPVISLPSTSSFVYSSSSSNNNNNNNNNNNELIIPSRFSSKITLIPNDYLIFLTENERWKE